MSGPAHVASGIGALFRVMPGPDVDSAAHDIWLEAKADFLDRIADAAATEDLRDEARACAAATRAAIPTVSTTSTRSTGSTVGGRR